MPPLVHELRQPSTGILFFQPLLAREFISFIWTWNSHERSRTLQNKAQLVLCWYLTWGNKKLKKKRGYLETSRTDNSFRSPTMKWRRSVALLRTRRCEVLKKKERNIAHLPLFSETSTILVFTAVKGVWQPMCKFVRQLGSRGRLVRIKYCPFVTVDDEKEPQWNLFSCPCVLHAALSTPNVWPVGQISRNINVAQRFRKLALIRRPPSDRPEQECNPKAL